MPKWAFCLLGAVLIAGSVLFGVTAFRPPPPCEQVAADAVSPTAYDHETRLSVEVGGNTSEWQQQARSFLVERLAAVPDRAGDRPARALVDLHLFHAGERTDSLGDCRTGSFRLGPSDSQMSEWTSANGPAREQLDRDYAALRVRQTAVVQDAVSDAVAALFFDGRDAALMSPVQPLAAVATGPSAAPARDAAVLFMGASTRDDCMDASDALDRLGAAALDQAPALADALVAGCLSAKQLVPLDVDSLALVPAAAANPTGQQRTWAGAVAAALCRRVVTAPTPCTPDPL